VEKILAAGLDEAVVNGDDTKALLEISDAETRKRGEGFIAELPDGTKRERMRLVFNLYMKGKNIEMVMAGANVSKGSVLFCSSPRPHPQPLSNPIREVGVRLSLPIRER